MIARYENEMERRQLALENERQLKYREEQARMRDFLAQQMADKRRREEEERSNIDAQANMWNLDKKNWEVEESRLKARIDKINKENQDFLLK